MLFEVDKLEGVAAGDGNGAFDHCYGGKGAAELVDLYIIQSVRFSGYEASNVPSISKPSTTPPLGMETS